MENLLGLLYSMLRSLPANSDARVRLLAKFVEKDYEKISLLLAYRARIADNWAASKRQTKSEWNHLSPEDQDARGGEEWLSDQLNERNFPLEVCLSVHSSVTKIPTNIN
jgi:beta-catenin-like protein 1